jgi:hypothetical protein
MQVGGPDGFSARGILWLSMCRSEQACVTHCNDRDPRPTVAGCLRDLETSTARHRPRKCTSPVGTCKHLATQAHDTAVTDRRSASCKHRGPALRNRRSYVRIRPGPLRFIAKNTAFAHRTDATRTAALPRRRPRCDERRISSRLSAPCASPAVRLYSVETRIAEKLHAYCRSSSRPTTADAWRCSSKSRRTRRFDVEASRVGLTATRSPLRRRPG